MTGVKDSVMHTGNNVVGAVRTGTNNFANATTTNYTTTRTAARGATFMGMSSTAWIWLVFGIVALAVILLSWYYMSDANRHDRAHND